MKPGTAVRALGAYLSVAVATVAGIIGMGMLFTATTSGPISLTFVGLPLLLIGLYWSGRALGQSLRVAQARHRHGSDTSVPPSAMRRSSGNLPEAH